MKYFVNYSGTKETFKDLEELYYKYIVFIEGSDLIYTHGHYYGDLKDAFEALKVEISDSINMLKEQVNTTDTDLYNNIDSLSNNLADNVDKLAKMITSNTKSILDLIDVLVNADASTAINTFNEIISFLEGIENSEDLDSIIASIEQLIANVNKSLEEHLAESLEIFITRSEVEDNYATTETLNLAVQAVNSNINGVNQSINSTLQNVNEKANKADTTATNALNLVEGIQGNLSSFALKSELTTKVSQLENDADYLPNTISNGVYVVDINGDLHDPNTFTGTSDDVTGVGLITDKGKWIVALDEWYSNSESTAWNGNQRSVWGVRGVNVTGCFLNSDKTQALLDFDGDANTDAIIAQLKGTTDEYSQYYTGAPAAEYCRAYSKGYKDVGSWYLPAAGELNEIILNEDAINAILTKLGKNSLSENSYTWSSSLGARNTSWRFHWITSGWYNFNKSDPSGVRPICKLEVFSITSRIKSLEDSISEIESQMITGDVKYIKKVTALPDNPDSNTLYILT